MSNINKQKRIAMIAGPWHPVPPIKGAAVEMWIYQVCKRLIKFQPYVISIGSEFLPEREFRKGIFFYRLNFGRFYKRIFQKFLGWDLYSYEKRICFILKRIKPQIVHFHNYLTDKIIDFIRKNLPDAKIILHMHNVKNMGNVLNKVDMLIGCSKFIESYYKNLNSNLVTQVVYNGVDLHKFNNKSRYKFLKNNDNYKKIFYIGRISPEKGVEKFIKLAYLCKDITDWKFFCVGEISQKGQRADFYKKLESFVKKYKLNNVEFWDYVSPFKIHLVYFLADVVVIPSKFEEPFGMVGIEAMAAEVPVISSGKGGMKEYMKNEKNAIIIEDYDNFEYIAKEKIKELLMNTEKRERIIKNAKKLVEEYFSWDVIANKLEKIYEGLLAK